MPQPLYVRFAGAQTVEEGLQNMDAHKYAKAKEVFNQLLQKSPSGKLFLFRKYLLNSIRT